MFTIIYEPLDTGKTVQEGWSPQKPSRAVQALSFWLGAQADDVRKGPFSIRTGTPKVPAKEPLKLTPGNIYRTEEGVLAYIYRELTIRESIKAGLVGRILDQTHGTTGEPYAWNQDGWFRGRLNKEGTVSVLCVPRLSIVSLYQPQES